MAQTIVQATEQNGGGSAHAGMAVLKQYWPQLQHLLPSHVRKQAWYAAVYAALYRGQNPTKDLDLWRAAERNPESLMFALFDAARQGLEPGTEQYYLTPRPNKNAKNGVEVLGIRGYQGEIELMYRAGAVSSVVVEAVRRNDVYRYRLGVDRVPVHEFDPWVRKSERGPLVGVYAYGVLRDGAVSKVVQLNRDDIDRAKRASPSAGKGGKAFWDDPDDEEAMWIKTGVHRLKKVVPTSAEYRNTTETITASAAALAAADGDQRRVSDAAVVSVPQPVEHQPEPVGSAPLDISQFVQPPAPDDDAGVEASRPEGHKPDTRVVEMLTEFPAVPAVGDDPPAGRGAQTTIARVLGKGGVTDDADRYAITARLAGRTRPVESTAELTAAEAKQVIILLTGWQDAGILPEQIVAIRAAMTTADPASGELPAVGTRAWHDAGHPTRDDSGHTTTVPVLRNGDCGICEQPDPDSGASS